MSVNKFAVYQIADFRLIFGVRLFAFIALQIQAVITGWQIYQIYPSALLLGLVGLVEAVPAIGCAFFSGHVVDTRRPSLVLQLSLALLVANSFFQLIAVAPAAPIDDQTRIVLLYLGVFVSGAARSFVSPAIFALVPERVPRHLIATAATGTSLAFLLSMVLGPAIGGLVYGQFGSIAAFASPIVVLLTAAVFSSLLSKRETLSDLTNQSVRSKSSPRQPSEAREPMLQSIKAGIKFMFQSKILLSATLLDMFSVLFGGAVSILPMFADQVLHQGAATLGFLRAAPSLGALAVAIYFSFRPMQTISGKVLLIVVAGFGAATIGFGLSIDVTSAMIFLTLLGVFDGVSVVIRSTLLQVLAPAQMRGRISALNSVFVSSSNEIGAFESGMAAQVLGLVPSVLFGGVMTLVIVAATWWLVPDLSKTRIATQ